MSGRLEKIGADRRVAGAGPAGRDRDRGRLPLGCHSTAADRHWLGGAPGRHARARRRVAHDRAGRGGCHLPAHLRGLGRQGIHRRAAPAAAGAAGPGDQRRTGLPLSPGHRRAPPGGGGRADAGGGGQGRRGPGRGGAAGPDDGGQPAGRGAGGVERQTPPSWRRSRPSSSARSIRCWPARPRTRRRRSASWARRRWSTSWTAPGSRSTRAATRWRSTPAASTTSPPRCRRWWSWCGRSRRGS